jgi:hypothetical protein
MTGIQQVTHGQGEMRAHVPALVWVGYMSCPWVKNHARTYLCWIGYLTGSQYTSISTSVFPYHPYA